jgi:hypothetical protein
VCASLLISAGVLDDAVMPPKVTPYLLRRVDDLCPRRLDHEFRGETGHHDPVHRARVRSAFVDAARAAHTRDLRIAAPPWPAPPWLTPEEAIVLEQAVHWYWRLFGDRAVHLDDHDLDRPSEIEGLGARLGGWVDLTLVGADGRRELRQLELWGRPPPVDLLADWGVRLALVRLAPWLGTQPVLVSWTDLLHGIRTEAEVDPTPALADARAAVAAAIGIVEERADLDVVVHGGDCAACRFHKGCPEFPRAMRTGTWRRDSLLPGVVALTPSSLDHWQRCRRRWRNQHVLQIPASDDETPGVHGRQVHALLHLLHRSGPCSEPERIDDVVAAHGASARVHAELVDHARRCPPGASSFGHELTRARLHPRAPNFVASARIDAAWIHDGILDVRDYKTGGAWHDRVADDARARLQAWVMAPVAAQLGVRLRVRYEHLATEIVDDPEEWDPDADDLAAVEAELVAVVTAMRAESEWAGVGDAEVCRTCRYRSICPDSASPAHPAWPRVDDDPEHPEVDGR